MTGSFSRPERRKLRRRNSNFAATIYALVSSNLLLILANLEIFESLIRPHEISESSAIPGSYYLIHRSEKTFPRIH
jgi:hypothetical protein